jgi:hypothetical protein
MKDRAWLPIWLLLAGAFAPEFCSAQCHNLPAEHDQVSSGLEVVVERTRVAAISADGLRLEVSLSVSGKRDLSIDQVALSNLRVNNVPVYAAPMTNKFSLIAGQRTLLPAIELTVYFRDLDTTAPLRQAIAQGQVEVAGTAILDFRLPGLAQIVLLSRRAQATVPFREDVAMEFPGGTVSKSAALHTLEAVDSLSQRLQAGIDSVLASRSEWRRTLWRDYASNLWFGYSRFDLRDPQGQLTTVECTGSALRISSTRVLVTKELLQPWKFDVGMAAAIHDRQLVLAEASYDLWLWPEDAKLRASNNALNPAAAYRLSQGQLRVADVPHDDMEKVVMPMKADKTARVSVHRRPSDSNLATLVVAGPTAAGVPQFAEKLRSESWDSVAVFRFRADPFANEVEPELIFISAHLERNRIIIDTALDSSAWGSALITPDGIIGIVQDENSAVAWPEIVQRFKLDELPRRTAPSP